MGGGGRLPKKEGLGQFAGFKGGLGKKVGGGGSDGGRGGWYPDAHYVSTYPKTPTNSNYTIMILGKNKLSKCLHWESSIIYYYNN